jgi:hypothetical protein
VSSAAGHDEPLVPEFDLLAPKLIGQHQRQMFAAELLPPDGRLSLSNRPADFDGGGLRSLYKDGDDRKTSLQTITNFDVDEIVLVIEPAFIVFVTNS